MKAEMLPHKETLTVEFKRSNGKNKAPQRLLKRCGALFILSCRRLYRLSAFGVIHPFDHRSRAVAQIVGDHHAVPRRDQFDRRMRPDKPGPAGKEIVPVRFLL